MLVAPSERPAAIKALGRSSLLPETYGCDIMFVAKGKMYGCQRKELKDFIASVGDGRLATDVAKMTALEQGIVVVEGRPRWTGDGELMGDGFGARWTRQSHMSMLFSIQARGVWVMGSDDAVGTAGVCLAFEAWVKKDRHVSLDARPGPGGNSWGRRTNRDFQRHVLQGFPGIGPVQADAILDAFQGEDGEVRSPLEWSDGALEKMLGIRGVGAKTVEKLRKAL